MFIPVEILETGLYVLIFILGFVVGFIVCNKINTYSNDDRRL